MKILIVDSQDFTLNRDGEMMRFSSLHSHLKKSHQVHTLINPVFSECLPKEDFTVHDVARELTPEELKKYEDSSKALLIEDATRNTSINNELQTVLRFENAFCPLNFIKTYEETVASFQPDLVVVRYAFFRRLKPYTPTTAKFLIDTPASLSAKLLKNAALNILNDVGLSKDQENSMLMSGDLLTFGSHDEAHLHEYHPPSATFLTNIGLANAHPRVAGQPLKFLIIDNEANSYVKTFRDDVWPQVASTYPQAELHIVEPSSPLISEAAAIINPVRSGSGVKISVMLALANGIPLISFKDGVDDLLPYHAYLSAWNWQTLYNRIVSVIEEKEGKIDEVSVARNEGKLWASQWLAEPNCYKSLDNLLEKAFK